MKNFRVFFILLIIPLTIQAQQHPAVSQPGYNPTVPRLFSMRHKATTLINKLEDVSFKDYHNKMNKEFIEVYFVYEKDSTIGKSSDHYELFHPPSKLMDLYIIYRYNYRFPLGPDNKLNLEVPKIEIPSNSYLKDLKITQHYLKKDKLQSVKLRNKNIILSNIDNKLGFSIEPSELIENSYLEVEIEIKSRNYSQLELTLTSDDNFDSELSISIPKLFSYKLNDTDSVKQTGKFELLHFTRLIGSGDIEVFDVGFDSYSWSDDEFIKEMSKITLEKINYPNNSDIGIPLQLLLSTN